MTASVDKHVLLVSAAIFLHQADEDQRAIEVLQEAIRQKADYTPAYVMLGASYQAAGQMQFAEEAFRKALVIDPNNSEALQGLGLFLGSQARYLESLPYLQKQLAKNPADQISLDGLIDALNHLSGREKEVEIALQNAWEKSKNADAGVRYGRYLLDHGNPTAARNTLAAVVEISKTARTLSELALTCFITDACDCAIQLLQEAVEIDPQFDRAWRGLSQCYNEAKNYDKALESAERAIAINPTHYRNWQAKADVLLSLGQFEKVIETSQKGIDLIQQKKEERAEAEPVLAALFLQRFNAFLQLGRLDEAVIEASFARSEIPTDGRFYQYPAEILIGSDKPEQALEILDSTSDLTLTDQFAPVRYKALHQLGRAQEAWNIIYPCLGKNTDKRLQILANIGVDFYKCSLIEPAMMVYRQLVTFKPDDVQFSTNLAYFLIGIAQHKEAEELLLRVINTEEVGIFGQIAQCNLAYLYNLTGVYPKALEIATAVLNTKFAAEGAILRIPFWFDHQMQSDPNAFPGRDITLGNAALACGTAAAIAMGQYDIAEQMVHKIKDENGQALQAIAFGCLEQAKENPIGAIQYWKTALEQCKDDTQRKTLEKWIKIEENKGFQ